MTKRKLLSCLTSSNVNSHVAMYLTYLLENSYNFIIGTSPLVWTNLRKGRHTVTVKASCVVGGVAISSTRLRMEFQVR